MSLSLILQSVKKQGSSFCPLLIIGWVNNSFHFSETAEKQCLKEIRDILFLLSMEPTSSATGLSSRRTEWACNPARVSWTPHTEDLGRVHEGQNNLFEQKRLACLERSFIMCLSPAEAPFHLAPLSCSWVIHCWGWKESEVRLGAMDGFPYWLIFGTETRLPCLFRSHVVSTVFQGHDSS